MKAEIDTGQISFFSNGENLIDYTIYGAAGGVGEHTSNLMPSAEKQTIEFDGMTLYCDGQGRYTISGRNNSDVEVFSPFLRLKSSFTIPICCTYGNGAVSFWNTGSLSDNNSLYFCNNLTEIDYWNLGTKNRQEKYYYVMEGKDCNAIQIKIGANYNGTFTLCPHITDDGKLPTAYEPYGYKIPITCGGVTTNIYLDEPLYEGDSITFSTAQVDIPTNNGQNTLTVDTQVKPSKIIVKTNKGIFQNTPENPPENKSSSDHPYNRKMDTRNKILRAWATKDDGKIVPKSWNHVQFLVKHGLHKDIFNIKDQFIMQKDNTNLVWDIIGKDHDTPSDSQYTRSMTLQLHDQFPTAWQFDAPEAFYYCEDGLAAGTYYFTIASTYDTTYNDLSAYGFTLTEAVSAGGVLTFPWAYNTNASTTKIYVYASRESTTPIMSVSVSENTSGINLGELKVAVQAAANLNSIQRVRYGSNNYKESAIRQWLNSDKPAGQVWTPQTPWDRPPNWVAIADGFMYGMDADFLAAIGKTHIVVSRNSACDGGGYDEMDDYFFLLSRREAYMDNEVASVIEGEPYPYYSDYSDLSTPGMGADSNRIKYRDGTAQYWWTRTPALEAMAHTRYVFTTGAMGNYGAVYGNIGIAPACNII